MANTENASLSIGESDGWTFNGLMLPARLNQSKAQAPACQAISYRWLAGCATPRHVTGERLRWLTYSAVEGKKGEGLGVWSNAASCPAPATHLRWLHPWCRHRRACQGGRGSTPVVDDHDRE